MVPFEFRANFTDSLASALTNHIEFLGGHGDSKERGIEPLQTSTRPLLFICKQQTKIKRQHSTD